ncbi:MAG: hypothetical protein AAF558_11270 [Verrucomicrobiota bacterium]
MNTQDPNQPTGGNSGDDLASVKRLLLEQELHRLDDLEHLVNTPAPFQEKVEKVLPSAIIARCNQDQRLQQALEGPIETSIQESVRRDPHALANALFPIMGPAIRQSIRDTVAKMVESFNQTLDQSLSPQSIRWRIEAKMTGKSFAEVVLAKTLLYRVEQAFLIHRETGLLLAHAINPSIQSKDADMVSGMFSAIQDFVHDSFDVDQGDQLETMRVGDMNVIVRGGPSALLAVTVRGIPTADLSTRIDEILEAIHRRFSQALETFEGDTQPFSETIPLLEDSLETKQNLTEEAKETKPAYHWWALAIVSLLTVCLVTFLYIRASNWNQLVQEINNTPGLAVQEAKLGWKHKTISGLRDPLSRPPMEIIEKFYDPSTIEHNWKPYQSLENEFLLKRLRKAANPPAGTEIKMSEGKLSLSGTPSFEWLEKLELLTNAQAGSIEFDLSHHKFRALRKRIESIVVPFGVGSSEIDPNARYRITLLSSDIQSLKQINRDLGKVTSIDVIGMADKAGNPAINERLSRERANRVIALLESLNISSNTLNSHAAFDANSSENNRRCVVFRIRN